MMYPKGDSKIVRIYLFRPFAIAQMLEEILYTCKIRL